MSEEKKEELAENGEKGISVREIFGMIGKKIWYVLGGAFAVTLAAVLVFMFAINPAKQSESMSFTIAYPMSNEGKYPDGSIFNYRDIVSRSVVQKTIERDEKFSAIDLDKVYKKEGISISAEKVSSEENAPYSYTVSLKRAYFGSVDTEEFIVALTEEFTAFVENKANSLNYQIDEGTFASTSYKDQLRILDDEKKVLKERYDAWINEYSAGHVVQGKSLNDYRTEVMTTLADSVRTPIENDLSAKGYEYFNDGVTGAEVKERVKQLQDEQRLNYEIIEGLKQALNGENSSSKASGYAFSYSSSEKSDGTSSDKTNVVIMPGEPDLSESLACYTKRAAIVAQQIANLRKPDRVHEGEATEGGATLMTDEDYNDIAVNIKSFGVKLSKQRDELNARANTLKTVVSSIYARDTVLTFNTQRVASTGGTSLAIVGAGVFVVSFLVFAVIAFFAGKKGMKKKANAAPSDENTDDGEAE